MGRSICYCGGCGREYDPEYDRDCPFCERDMLQRAIDSQRKSVDYLNSRWGSTGTGKPNSRRRKRRIAEYILDVLEEKAEAVL